MSLLKKTSLTSHVNKFLKKMSIKPEYKTPLLGSPHTNLNDVAIIDHNSSYKFKYLMKQSDSLKAKIESLKIKNKNVAVLLPNDVSFVIGLFGIWKSKNAVVPLNIENAQLQLEYFIEDSESSAIVTTSSIHEKLNTIFIKMRKEVIVIDNEVKPLSDQKLEDYKKKPLLLTNKTALSRALIIYTSGTTGKPKGVVLSHLNVAAQVQSIIEAWKINNKDTSLHCLPLDHVHGIINALLCPLASGGKVMMEPKFDAYEIWQKLTIIPSLADFHPTIFMAVPTIYSKLIDMYHATYYDKPYCRDFIKIALSKYIRLMVSGSAPLRPQILNVWKEISDHTLLERYGMTEIGMALTNPLDGERKPGFVGKPFPGVEVRIAADLGTQFGEAHNILCKGNESYNGSAVASVNQVGELQVKSDNVFSEYYNRPKETAEGFTEDGWFCTGDTAIYLDDNYKILGRTSVDIIKSGGFKVSALEIENVLLNYPNVTEIAVVSIHDRTWGEKICAIIVLEDKDHFDNAAFINWAKQQLSHYQVPKVIKIFDGELPRNAMGKLNKKELVEKLFSPNDII